MVSVNQVLTKFVVLLVLWICCLTKQCCASLGFFQCLVRIEQFAVVPGKQANGNTANNPRCNPQYDAEIAEGISEQTVKQSAAAEDKEGGVGTDSGSDQRAQMFYPPLLWLQGLFEAVAQIAGGNEKLPAGRK